MSKFVNDVNEMHAKFGVHDWVDEKFVNVDTEALKEFLKFRIDFLQEEVNEAKKAFEEENAEDIVDSMIDLIVVALGTLDAFYVHPNVAWDEVHSKNMQKEPGVKPNRPNPLGLPDLIKPEGWSGPDHSRNTGIIGKDDLWPGVFSKNE